MVDLYHCIYIYIPSIHFVDSFKVYMGKSAIHGSYGIETLYQKIMDSQPLTPKPYYGCLTYPPPRAIVHPLRNTGLRAGLF